VLNLKAAKMLGLTAPPALPAGCAPGLSLGLPAFSSFSAPLAHSRAAIPTG
jgi:hypothetical protein